jgi:uncharacterized protein YndB with AHSA1/START domain
MKTIHHVVDIDAATEPLWRALTEADGLASWWSTKVTTDGAIVGTEVRFTFAGDFNPVMQITAITDGHKLEWLCVDGHDYWKDNTFEFELASLADGRTRLRFSQHYATELSDDDYGIYNFNWGYYLESLRLLLTTGTGQPYSPARPV